MEKKLYGNGIEISDNDQERFDNSIRYVMKNDQKWRALSPNRKCELIKEAYRNFFENPWEEVNSCQSFANALYWMLQSIGHEASDTADIWNKALQHAVIKSTKHVTKRPN